MANRNGRLPYKIYQVLLQYLSINLVDSSYLYPLPYHHPLFVLRYKSGFNIPFQIIIYTFIFHPEFLISQDSHLYHHEEFYASLHDLLLFLCTLEFVKSYQLLVLVLIHFFLTFHPQ